MKSYSQKIVLFFICLFLTVPLFCDEEKETLEKDIYEYLELFSNSLYLIQRDYVDDVDSQKLIYGALKGMMRSLDSHSQFMDQDAYKDMKVETEGKFGGLGIEISLKDDFLTVVSPIEGTPAYDAGILSGDRIVKIEDTSTKDMSLIEAVHLLRGKSGTKVKITIMRTPEKDLIDMEIVRAIIKLDSIKQVQILDDQAGIGYIRLTEFQELSGKDLGEAIEELASKGMNSLILDLRNNPGGLLQISVEVADKFIQKGKVIVSTKGKREKQNIIFKTKEPVLTDVPLIILINKGSASASEIVAGAIQDYKRGLLLGETTFGKGSVQSVIPLKDESALRLTTAKYFTPNERCIDSIGIVPDIEVIISQEETKELRKKREEKDALKKLDDPQIKKAVEIIKNNQYLLELHKEKSETPEEKKETGSS